MNLATIILLLQTAIALLGTPNMTFTERQEAVNFANQALILAEQALNQPEETTLGSVITTSTPPQTPQITTMTPIPQPVQPISPWLPNGCNPKLPNCDDPKHYDFYLSRGQDPLKTPDYYEAMGLPIPQLFTPAPPPPPENPNLYQSPNRESN